MVLVSQVIYQNHVVKGSSSFWMGATWVSHHPTRFGGRRDYGIADKMVLVCHWISQDHVIKGACFGACFGARFGDHTHSGRWVIMIFLSRDPAWSSELRVM